MKQNRIVRLGPLFLAACILPLCLAACAPAQDTEMEPSRMWESERASRASEQDTMPASQSGDTACAEPELRQTQALQSAAAREATTAGTRPESSANKAAAAAAAPMPPAAAQTPPGKSTVAATQRATAAATVAPTAAPAPTTQREIRPATASETLPAVNNNAFLTGYETQVARLVNEQRAQNGLPALTVTASLRDTAHLRAVELTKSYSHTRPDGSSCFTAFPPSHAYGENVARGQNSPEDVMQSWMGSSAHRANILNPDFTQLGVGCIREGDTLYWVQCFTA